MLQSFHIAARPRIRSEAFSAIISTQALMWAETRSGMAEAHGPAAASVGLWDFSRPRPLPRGLI
jgi:hypothetical protein